MEYVIIGILVVLLILVVILIMRRNNNNDLVDRINRLELEVVKEISDFKSDFARNINEDFDKLNDRMDNKLSVMNDKVNSRLDENFERTNKTFTNVLERLSKIDEAQKKIDSLSTDIVSLQGVLTDKKTRGIFGEVNLEHILSNVFGINNKTIYQTQYTLPNGTIADSVLFAPEPLGMIAIDSKFPLESYQIMVDKNNSAHVRMQAEKQFKVDMKKHIDAISSKYIIPGVTKVIIKNIERDKYAKVIHNELILLDTEFKRYKERWDKLYRSIETVSKDVKDIHTTTDKITKRFNSINQVEMDTKEISINE